MWELRAVVVLEERLVHPPGCLLELVEGIVGEVLVRGDVEPLDLRAGVDAGPLASGLLGVIHRAGDVAHRIVGVLDVLQGASTAGRAGGGPPRGYPVRAERLGVVAVGYLHPVAEHRPGALPAGVEARTTQQYRLRQGTVGAAHPNPLHPTSAQVLGPTNGAVRKRLPKRLAQRVVGGLAVEAGRLQGDADRVRPGGLGFVVLSQLPLRTQYVAQG